MAYKAEMKRKNENSSDELIEVKNKLEVEKKRISELEKENRRLKTAAATAGAGAIAINSRVEDKNKEIIQNNSSEVDGLQNSIEDPDNEELFSEKVELVQGQVVVSSAEVEELKAEIEDLKTQLASHEANTGKKIHHRLQEGLDTIYISLIRKANNPPFYIM